MVPQTVLGGGWMSPTRQVQETWFRDAKSRAPCGQAALAELGHIAFGLT